MTFVDDLNTKTSSLSKFRQSKVHIRRGLENDTTRVTQLIQNHYNWININNSPFSVVQRRATEDGMRDALIRYPSAIVEYEGVVVGFVLTIPQEPTLMQIRHVYVDDAYRRNGLARKMLEEVERQILAAGYSTIMATSSTHWYPGKELPTRLFKSLGFEVRIVAPGTEMYLRTLTDAEIAPVDDAKQLFGIRHIHYTSDNHY